MRCALMLRLCPPLTIVILANCCVFEKISAEGSLTNSLRSQVDMADEDEGGLGLLGLGEDDGTPAVADDSGLLNLDYGPVHVEVECPYKFCRKRFGGPRELSEHVKQVGHFACMACAPA